MPSHIERAKCSVGPQTKKIKQSFPDIRHGVHDADDTTEPSTATAAQSPSPPGGGTFEADHPVESIMRLTRKFYGWQPDLPDARDRFLPLPDDPHLPPSVDLRADCAPVYDQGPIGSCTANAISGMMQFVRCKENLEDWTPSRLFIYYNERVAENSVAMDAGAQLRDGLRSVSNQGACNEADWPYDDTAADMDGKFPAGCRAVTLPDAELYKAALDDRAVEYLRVYQFLTNMKACLADGYPFVFGFTVFDGFESEEVARTGVAHLPNLIFERPVGGHAVMAVGYNDATDRFLVRNSWGSDWGQKGYFTIPYAYLCNPCLASDFWTIRAI